MLAFYIIADITTPQVFYIVSNYVKAVLLESFFKIENEIHYSTTIVN